MQDGMQDEFYLNCVSLNLQEMLAITLISTCASCCFILRVDFNASAHMLELMLLAFYRSFFFTSLACVFAVTDYHKSPFVLHYDSKSLYSMH